MLVVKAYLKGMNRNLFSQRTWRNLLDFSNKT